MKLICVKACKNETNKSSCEEKQTLNIKNMYFSE